MAKSFNARMKDRFLKITADYAKINQYVHETAVMIAKHAKEHGDCSTAQGLVMAMPASTRREMLILWFSTYTPIVVKNNEDFESKMHKPESKMFVDWDIEGGEADPFFEMAKRNKEQEPKDFAALVALVHALGPKIEKMIENDQVEAEDIPSAEAMAARLKGLRFQRVQPSNDDDNNATGDTPQAETPSAAVAA